MLIVYRTITGEVLDSTGTNSAWPLGPPDELAYRNTDAAGIDQAGLALLRLHDLDDADLVALAMTRQVRVVAGTLVDVGPLAVAKQPLPDLDARRREDLAMLGDAVTEQEWTELMNLTAQSLVQGARE